jgi:thiaminase/transcriptional activator TenA
MNPKTDKKKALNKDNPHIFQGLDTGQTSFSEIAWNSVVDLITKILSHPFVQKLSSGTLDPKKFKFYVEQDSLYLDDFGRILSAAALKTPDQNDAQTLMELALDTIKVEKALHDSYLKGENRNLRQSPSCLLYTSYLHRLLLTSPSGRVMAGLLPCYWIYMVVGRHILSLESVPDNPYQSWIETYGGNDYAVTVDKFKKMTDRLAAESSPGERHDMLEAFVMASNMEYLFWDGAWNIKPWPDES